MIKTKNWLKQKVVENNLTIDDKSQLEKQKESAKVPSNLIDVSNTRNLSLTQDQSHFNFDNRSGLQKTLNIKNSQMNIVMEEHDINQNVDPGMLEKF